MREVGGGGRWRGRGGVVGVRGGGGATAVVNGGGGGGVRLAARSSAFVEDGRVDFRRRDEGLRGGGGGEAS